MTPRHVERPHVEPWLREILRCPVCLSFLDDATGPDGQPELLCSQPDPDSSRPGEEPGAAPCGRAYRFESGIPVLLADEARLP